MSFWKSCEVISLSYMPYRGNVRKIMFTFVTIYFVWYELQFYSRDTKYLLNPNPWNSYLSECTAYPCMICKYFDVWCTDLFVWHLQSGQWKSWLQLNAFGVNKNLLAFAVIRNSLGTPFPPGNPLWVSQTQYSFRIL